jgi:ABC-2 type transport system ATP-binding protein
MSAAIDARGLVLRYRARNALDHLTLQLPRGGVHAIVGANGAGKSSLFRVLLGFESPTAGTSTVLGCPSTALTPALRGRIGFVNEEHALPGWMRVDALARMQRHQYPAWNETRYTQVLRHFNVLPAQKVAQLSRGERAGVSLAMALAQRPELLILDEPTLGLDVVAKRAFLDALMDCGYDDGATIVYCSHQMDEIERVADELIILERGQVRLQATPADFTARVSLWMAEFPFQEPPELAELPGLLQHQRLEGLTHLLVLDAGPDTVARLKLLGARVARRMDVSLERAVNGMLACGHAA